jgi:N-acetylglutamate synthase-like GNAT family acetyltransferase
MEISIIPFDKQYATHFYELNVVWLEKYFYVEDYDREVLSKPQQYIIDPGGHIFFAIQNNEILGTVALLKNEEGIYELTKMAVSPKHQDKKVGQLIMQYCIDFAKENKYKKLFLYSHTILANAIYIYRKYGFIEIDVETDSPYERSDIKMELVF